MRTLILSILILSINSLIAKPHLTCHVSILKCGFYDVNGKEAIFNLAKNFFKKEVGINIEFKFYPNKDSIPNFKDKKRNIRIVETKIEDIIKNIEKLQKNIDPKIKSLEKAKKEAINVSKKMTGTSKSTIDNIIIQYILQIERLNTFKTILELDKFDVIMNISGYADMLNNTIHLFSPQDLQTFSLMNTSEDVEIAFIKSKNKRSELNSILNSMDSKFSRIDSIISRNKGPKIFHPYPTGFKDTTTIPIPKKEIDLIKTGANTVVHELGHLFGLDHTIGVKGGRKILDYVSTDIPNVMSYELINANHKYGFDMIQSQKEKIRFYFNNL